jgi:dethiobiotin synthetase
VTRRLLVTGTDTGVGKTLVTAGLCAWLKQQGQDVLGFKPVESGTGDNEGVPADAALLARCSGVAPAHCNVYALPEPLAPVLAASRAGVSIDITRLDAAFERACAGHEFVLVEGVGGARVEVAPGVDVADLAGRWGLSCLVVAANRLGVISHTLLTVEALRRRHVAVLGVVLNNVQVETGLAEETNGQELSRLLPCDVPLLGLLPFVELENREKPEALAAAVCGVADGLYCL